MPDGLEAVRLSPPLTGRGREMLLCETRDEETRAGKARRGNAGPVAGTKYIHANQAPGNDKWREPAARLDQLRREPAHSVAATPRRAMACPLLLAAEASSKHRQHGRSGSQVPNRPRDERRGE